MRLNLKAIAAIFGILMIINGTFMLLCLPAAYFFQNNFDLIPISFSGCLTITLGLLMWLSNKSGMEKGIGKRDGYVIVTFGWIIMSLSGTLPYLLSGAIPHFTDAFFETISGYTTTGASILDDIESIPQDILLWRSLTQWIGGMGIIVLAVAILPLLGIGGMQLFVAESPGIKPDKLQPRIRETAKRLWYIYVGLTFVEAVLLKIGGMSLFDAVNHSLTTMATGGFSTKQASIAHFTSPFIQYVIIFFMIMAGTNFTLSYFALKGNFKKVWANEEYRYYVGFIGVFTVITFLCVLWKADLSTEESFRSSLFSVVTVITTTGYVTADYTSWAPFLTILFFMLMFFGGSAGSTAGGVKIVRHIVLLKNSFLELKRQLHPSAIIPVRLNHNAITQDITYNILAFIIIYIMIFAVSSFILGFSGVDMLTATGAVATALGNIGPGIGSVSPVDNFAHISSGGKWFLSFLMLVGRLELFTVLILLSPAFWSRH